MEPKPNLYFFVPGLSEKYRTGGLMVIRDVAEIFKKLGAKTYFVATHEKHPDALTPDVIHAPSVIPAKDSVISAPPVIPAKAGIYIVTWGPLVSSHIKLIQKREPKARVIYYAQSFGWDIKIPLKIPIVCVSRFVMSQWALHAQENYVAYIPPPLHACFRLENSARDIDILVHERKQNRYCLHELLPALKAKNLNIEIIRDWIPQEKFAGLLNRSKIFLYVTELHKAGWRRRLPGEGFGLPALEAVACGCMVGSNLLGGVTDFLTPGENCIKLQNGDLDFDIKQIHEALKNFNVNEKALIEIVSSYSFERIMKKWEGVLEKI